MAANKALLKEIGQDLQKSKFSDAISKAKEVLERDPKNYQAFVIPPKCEMPLTDCGI
jgi:superkiller protein 3